MRVIWGNRTGQKFRRILGVFAVSAMVANYSFTTVAGASSTWQNAVEITSGLSNFNLSNARVVSVSCPESGYCSATGTYDNGSVQQPFVVDEIAGVWQAAQKLPSGPLGFSSQQSYPVSISCATASNCSVVGNYSDGSNPQVFVASEVGGTWGPAARLTGSVDAFGQSYVYASGISCSSPGTCGVTGYFQGFVVAQETLRHPNLLPRAQGSSYEMAFVADETGGTWSPASLVSGTGNFDTSTYNRPASISCASDGNCSIVGKFWDGNYYQAFAASEVSSSWLPAAELTSSDPTFNENDAAGVQVSCSSAGNCGATGYYYDVQQLPLLRHAHGSSQGEEVAFVVNQVGGVWQDAVPVSGLPSGNYYSTGTSISCTSATNCSAVGDFRDSGGYRQAYGVSEVAGTWGSALEFTSTLTNFNSSTTLVTSISCASNGNCSAVGTFNEAVDPAYAVDQVSGTWLSPVQLMSSAEGFDSSSNLSAPSVSCPTEGLCSAGGGYYDGDYTQPYVVGQALDETPPPPPPPAGSPPGPVTNLVVTSSGDPTTSATFTGSVGATSYTCQLMYGYNEPSPFIVIVTTTSCSFPGLTAGIIYGVGVTANNSYGSSIQVVAFPAVSGPTTTTPTTTTTTPPPPPPPPSNQTVSGKVYFAFNKWTLTAAGQTTLTSLANQVNADGISHLTIIGWADEIGTNGYNLTLSLHRANVVAAFLSKALAADGDNGVSFSVAGRGILKAYANRSLDRVVTING